jgi:hypothetical protein
MGKENGMSDVLSQDIQLTFAELTHLLHFFIPEQVPPNLTVCPMLPAI